MANGVVLYKYRKMLGFAGSEVSAIFVQTINTYTKTLEKVHQCTSIVEGLHPPLLDTLLGTSLVQIQECTSLYKLVQVYK